MRDSLTLVVAFAGLALFVAGDVLWAIRRQRGRPMNLRLTGTLITAGVALFLFAALVLRPA